MVRKRKLFSSGFMRYDGKRYVKQLTPEIEDEMRTKCRLLRSQTTVVTNMGDYMCEIVYTPMGTADFVKYFHLGRRISNDN